MIEPFKKNTPSRARARGMGEVMKYSDSIKDDKKLAEVVREIIERVRQEEAAYRASLNEHGAPLKIL